VRYIAAHDNFECRELSPAARAELEQLRLQLAAGAGDSRLALAVAGGTWGAGRVVQTFPREYGRVLVVDVPEHMTALREALEIRLPSDE
jgi:hypothetical protein